MTSAAAPAPRPLTNTSSSWQLGRVRVSQGWLQRASGPAGCAALLIPGAQPLSWRQGNVDQILRPPNDLLYLAADEPPLLASSAQGWRLDVDPGSIIQLAVACSGHRLSLGRCRRRLQSSRGLQLRGGTEQGQVAALRQMLQWSLGLPEAGQQALTAAGLEAVVLQLLCQLLCGDLIAAALQQRPTARGSKAQIIDDLLQWIASHLHQPILLDDLVRESGYSQRSLRNIFHDRFHCGPVQWIRQQRLERARQLLLAPPPGATVSSVAGDCGYDHLSQFSRDFRSAYGLRPSELLREGRRSAAS